MQKGYLRMQRYIALQKIVELGSFTKAANLLGYTQPAMSQMISSLWCPSDAGRGKAVSVHPEDSGTVPGHAGDG